MPASASPHVVMLGVSPGAAKNKEDAKTNKTGSGFPPPTFGTKHHGFAYGVQYWRKVSDLGAFLVKRDAPNLGNDDALALCTHFNLGTGQHGRAGAQAIEKRLLQWVSRTIHRKLDAKLLVCFGLNGILAWEPWLSLWNCSGGLKVDWRHPEVVEPFSVWGKFRCWMAHPADGGTMAVIMWPNHPSRVPFGGGSETANWKAVKREADAMLGKLGY